MIIYHGSEKIIKKPKYEFGKQYNDYGQGFYCTESLEMALEWAVEENRNGFANHYEIDLSDLRILNLNSSEYCILHWLSVLLENRYFDITSIVAEEARKYIVEQFHVDYQDCDIIIGYRADDSYFSFAQDFVAGAISLRKLSEAMRLGKLGEQIVLKSEKAYSRIRFLDAEAADADTYYEKKAARDREARREYRKTRKETDGLSEIYMLDIMREGMENGDPRLQ